jgi:hypothetical protein
VRDGMSFSYGCLWVAAHLPKRESGFLSSRIR